MLTTRGGSSVLFEQSVAALTSSQHIETGRKTKSKKPPKKREGNVRFSALSPESIAGNYRWARLPIRSEFLRGSFQNRDPLVTTLLAFRNLLTHDEKFQHKTKEKQIPPSLPRTSAVCQPDLRRKTKTDSCHRSAAPAAPRRLPAAPSASDHSIPTATEAAAQLAALSANHL